MSQRKAVLASQVRAWPKATKAEKSAILDHLVAVNGWHRDHARKRMRAALVGKEPPPQRPREPRYTYPPECIEALAKCWATLGGPAGKVLAAALADLVPALVRHDELALDPDLVQALTTISAATIDRRLKPYKVGLVAGKARSMTKPGTLLKSSIPLKTWHEWDDTTPGFIEIDLVCHDGGDNNGHFHYTLNATDIATGWTEAITVHSKGERIVSAGLDQLRLAFQFAVLGIHSGSETRHPCLGVALDAGPSPGAPGPHPSPRARRSRRRGWPTPPQPASRPGRPPGSRPARTAPAPHRW